MASNSIRQIPISAIAPAQPSASEGADCCASNSCAPASQPTLELRLPTMCCGSEAKAVRSALETLPGLGTPRFDMAARTLAVDAPESTWPEIIAAITGLGLPVEPATHGAGDSCCAPTLDQATTTTATAPIGMAGMPLLLRIPAMDCPVEEGQIRRALEPLGGGVRSLRFDLPGRTLGVDASEENWPRITDAIAKAGFAAEPIAAPPRAEDTARAQRKELLKLIAALAVATGAELVHFFAPETLLWKGVGLGVAAAAIGLSGLSVFQKGLSALRRGDLNINALMSVAVIGAFLIGQWPEAAMVMALYALAELIEARSVERARNAIAGLLALSPEQAEVRQADGSWLIQDAKAVPVGAIARVKPGERFALDGVITGGQSAVDQSPVTGESIPVDKAPGDEVYAGTINQNGALEFEVMKPASNTVLARIIHAVEEAQGQRAPMQRFVDRFAAVYTPAVFVLALAIAIGMPLLLGGAWLTAVYKALVLLVIACPCALVISTPVTVVSGLAAAARRGILVKGGVYLEEARKLRVIALDKTGTLTEGRPKLVERKILSTTLPETRALELALSLASRSDHPVAKAVAAGIAGHAKPVDNFGAELGRGVHGTVDQTRLVLCNHRWIHERGQCTPELERLMRQHEAQGRTVSVLADEQEVLALFAVADTVKPSSAQAVAELKALGVRSVMLTGDNEATGQAIAAQVGVDEVKADLLPADKLAQMQQWRDQGLCAGMVGDGVNDSPSLAAAHVGFSMGAAGTDTAKEAADVLIMNDDLRRVPETIRLSRRTHAVLLQNIALALGIKAVFFGLAVFADASMWMAVFADMGASLLVVFNGLRLLRHAPPVGPQR